MALVRAILRWKLVTSGLVTFFFQLTGEILQATGEKCRLSPAYITAWTNPTLYILLPPFLEVHAFYREIVNTHPFYRISQFQICRILINACGPNYESHVENVNLFNYSINKIHTPSVSQYHIIALKNINNVTSYNQRCHFSGYILISGYFEVKMFRVFIYFQLIFQHLCPNLGAFSGFSINFRIFEWYWLLNGISVQRCNKDLEVRVGENGKFADKNKVPLPISGMQMKCIVVLLIALPNLLFCVARKIW